MIQSLLHVLHQTVGISCMLHMFITKTTLQGAHTYFLAILNFLHVTYFRHQQTNCRLCRLILCSKSQGILANSIVRNRVLTVIIQLALQLMTRTACVELSWTVLRCMDAMVFTTTNKQTKSPNKKQLESIKKRRN